MKTSVSLSKVYKVSEDVVARDIHGEHILIPIANGIDDADEAIFTLNKTGKAIWDELDGAKTLKEVSRALCQRFDAKPKEIETDLQGIVGVLLKKRMLVEVK